MSKFAIFRAWMAAAGNSVEAATFARLKIDLDGRNITEFEGEHDLRTDHLEIPLYYLAEWIAENWWPLLWEPRKSEDLSAGRDFLGRHSPLAAQHGFVLPKLEIISAGDEIVVSASPRNVEHADVRMRNGGRAILPRREVEAELRKLVTGVVARLGEKGISETDLQAEWALIQGTQADEEEFCRLMGALGLSPYAANDRVADALEQAASIHDGTALMDLCLAATPGTIEATVKLIDQAKRLTETAPESTLEPLKKVSVPLDNQSLPAWKRGVAAATAVRRALKIKDTDVNGSNKFFDALGIEIGGERGSQDQVGVSDTAWSSSEWESEGQPIVGAIQRDEMRSRIALLQRQRAQRKFTAARCAFMAWTAEHAHEHRLVTMAVTRDQQASRAFAVEMTAPIAYLRSVARSQPLMSDDVYGVANALGVNPDVVRKQAQNNNLRLGRPH